MLTQNRWRGPDSFWSARWSGQEARHSCYALAGLHFDHSVPGDVRAAVGRRSQPPSGWYGRGDTCAPSTAPGFSAGFFMGLWRNGIRPRLGSGDPSQDLRVRIPPAPPFTQNARTNLTPIGHSVKENKRPRLKRLKPPNLEEFGLGFAFAIIANENGAAGPSSPLRTCVARHAGELVLRGGAGAGPTAPVSGVSSRPR